MNKLTFYEYFPQKQRGRPRITRINILRYLSRFGKTRRAKIAKDFGKNNQEINDAIKALVKQNLVINYCDLCKTEIENYDSWKIHKNTKKHKNKLKEERKNENIEKSKPVIIITKKGFEIAIYDPLENKGYDFLEEDKRVKKQWGVITTKQFWNILIEIFNDANDYNDLDNICKIYENSILEIFRENITPHYFRRTLKEFMKYNDNLYLFQKDKSEEIFVDDLILKTIAHGDSLNVSKSYVVEQIKKEYRLNNELFEKHFKKFLTRGIIEKISKDNQETYQITHLGIILLFHFLNTDTIFYNKPSEGFEEILESIMPSKKLDEESFYRDFDKIRKKYAYLLPMILDESNFKKLNLKKYGFLKIFDELYFSDIEDFFGEYNFNNFRKFYDIRDVDFNKKFDNYITSFSLSKIPEDELFKTMDTYMKVKSKKIDRIYNKIFETEDKYRNNLVYIKNTTDRIWIAHYPADMLFDKFQYNKDENYNLYNQLSIKFKDQIMSSIENKITFDFYSTYGKYDNAFEITFNNTKVENWYVNQLEQLSKYVSHYFDKIMF